MKQNSPEFGEWAAEQGAMKDFSNGTSTVRVSDDTD